MNPYLRITQQFKDTAIIYRKLILQNADWSELPESRGEWPKPRVELLKEIGWAPDRDYAIAEMGLWLGDTLVVKYPVFLWFEVEGLQFIPASTSPEMEPSGYYRTGNPIIHLTDPNVYTLDAAGGFTVDLLLDEETASEIDQLMDTAYNKWTPKIAANLDDMKEAFKSALFPYSSFEYKVGVHRAPDGASWRVYNEDGTYTEHQSREAARVANKKRVGKENRIWAASTLTDSDSYIDFAFIWIPRKGYVPVYLAGHKDPNGRVTKAENATFDPAEAVQDALNMLATATDIDMQDYLPTQKDFLERVTGATNELREKLEKGEQQ